MSLSVRIRVHGRLSERSATAFEGMTPHHQRGRTDLVGDLVDDAHLHAHLRRIRDLGLKLEALTVVRMTDSQSPR